MNTEVYTEANHRRILHKNEFFEIVSIKWTVQSESLPHNHGWSQCMVLIEDGVFENCLDLGMKVETQVLKSGHVLNTPVGAKHSLKCLSDSGQTFHVYVPKIEVHQDHGQFKVPNLENLKLDLNLNDPTDIDQLRRIMTQIREHSISTNSPYFMNQLFSGILPQMLMAEELICTTKTTLATNEASPAFSNIEQEVIQSLGKIIGWPIGKRDGVTVPGGSFANFMAIHCARHNYASEIKLKGMVGHKFKVYTSSEAHYSLKKACVVLGFGSENLASVPVDSFGKMIPQELQRMISRDKSLGFTPLIVVATAGTTVLGAFDPLIELSKICNSENIWLHVDGAWGGPALFSKTLRPLVNGIEQADSMTFDAHKLFGANLTCSFFLTKHFGILLNANDVSGADYLFHSEDEYLDRGKMSWQCGRRAEATSFWSIWKSMGTEGLGDFVDKLVAIREQTVTWIKTQPRLQLVASPEYLNICVRVVPSIGQDPKDWSKLVREELKEKNLAMVNYSINQDGAFLRLILAHPFLEFSHVKEILEWALAT